VVTAPATGIEWTDTTWNPVSGCSKVSPGCAHCYAETFTRRFAGPEEFATVRTHPDRVGAPLRWRRGRRVFVNSMADLFHPAVGVEFLARVWAVMAVTERHTYQVLTKRHARMRALLGSERFRDLVVDAVLELVATRGAAVAHLEPVELRERWWPLRNVWCGVSVEDQQRAELRVPALLGTPSVVRFVSCEPLLAPVDLSGWLPRPHQDRSVVPGLGWVIVGGESGPGARPLHPGWVEALITQCEVAGVGCFVKQLGSVWARAHHQRGKGGDPAAWPARLRVREFPPNPGLRAEGTW